MKTIRIGGLALLLLATAAIAGIGWPEAAGGADEDTRQGITVTGVGRVESVPNEAQFSVGVSSRGESSREALSANAVQMSRVVAAVKRAGVPERDIKTQDVSVSPNYDGTTDGPSGYVARNSVSVRVRNLDRASAVLEAASAAGANEVSGPSLTRANREGFETKALENAFVNARKRAEVLADAAGVELGRVTAIVEGFSGGPPILFAGAERPDLAAKAPIEPGTEEAQASVTVTFAIE